MKPTHEEIYEVIRKTSKNPRLTKTNVGCWEVHIKKEMKMKRKWQNTLK